MRHFVFAALVVLVVNAQLTWWIVFGLRLNRGHLELERQRLLATAGLEAVQVSNHLEEVRERLRNALLGGAEPGRSSVPAPFAGWRRGAAENGCPPALLNTNGGIEIGVEVGAACVSAVVTNEWQEAMLAYEGELEVVEVPGGDPVSAAPPNAALSPPFTKLAVRPRPDVWGSILEAYRSRIVMMVSEGGFFAVLLLVLMGLLWRTFRREVELQRQHRNFLSAITHELKSPLAAMRLALETVLSGRAPREAGERFLKNALEDTGRLQDLVQKVLEATRFGEGGAQLRLRRADLSDVVEGAVEIFSRRTLGPGAPVTPSISPGITGEIDEEAIGIVVSNLLENAVKYGGDPPLVQVCLELQGSDAVLEVGDNGRGVSEEEVPFIFQRFYRSGEELTRTTHGTGLGLYLVQQIVAAHRGTVQVGSTGPEGTVFRVTLPGFVEEEGEP